MYFASPQHFSNLHKQSTKLTSSTLPEKPLTTCRQGSDPSSVAVQVNFGDEISVWRLPRHDTLGKIATEHLVVTVAHSCRVCYKTEDGSNLWGKSNYFGDTR